MNEKTNKQTTANKLVFLLLVAVIAVAVILYHRNDDLDIHSMTAAEPASKDLPSSRS
jgi:hypothetical protein